VVASIAVGVGIIFERPKYSAAVHRVAFWLVVTGIVVEAICTIFLFVFDEGISSAQQSKIIVLEGAADALLGDLCDQDTPAAFTDACREFRQQQKDKRSAKPTAPQ